MTRYEYRRIEMYTLQNRDRNLINKYIRYICMHNSLINNCKLRKFRISCLRPELVRNMATSISKN